MTTSQFIDALVRKSNTTLSRAQLLTLTNQCQNEILDYDTPLTRLRPDPILPTTSGTYAYTVDAATITAVSNDGRLARRVRRMYVRGNVSLDYNSTSAYGTWQDGGVNAIGIPLYNTPAILQESTNPVDSAANYPVVRFDTDDNPGTTTNVFSLELYMWPTQLTAESVALTIPAAHQLRVLMDRVMMEIESDEYGRNDIWEEKYERHLKEFLQAMARNSTSDSNEVQFRDL